MRILHTATACLFLAACGGAGEAVATNEEAASAQDVQAAETTGGWIVDMDQSRLGFTASQNDKAFEGRFKDFDAAIVLDPDNLDAASIDVTISMSSAETGDRQRDSALPGKDWFDVKNYETARFVSTDISSTGDNTYEARGALTIRDVTEDIILPFSLVIDGDTAKAEGAVTLMRDTFGVGRGEFTTGKWVGLSVEVTVDISATR